MTWLLICVVWLLLLRWARWGREYQERQKVSGNRSSMGGPKWEQDAPLAECFDDMHIEMEDDL